MSVYLFFRAFPDSECIDTTNISRHPLLCYLVTLKRKWCCKEPIRRILAKKKKKKKKKRRILACFNDHFSRCWGIRTCTLSESWVTHLETYWEKFHYSFLYKIGLNLLQIYPLSVSILVCAKFFSDDQRQFPICIILAKNLSLSFALGSWTRQ